MIILISGKQGSGKTTLAKALEKKLKELNFEVHKVKFADPLYEMHDKVLEVLAKYGKERGLVKDGPLLQLLGTEWGRRTVSENIWCDLTKNKVLDVLSTGNNKKAIIIDDARFENEFDSFKSAFKVRLECSKDTRKKRCDSWRENDTHPSETGLDFYSEMQKFDFMFDTGVTDTEEVCNELVKDIVF